MKSAFFFALGAVLLVCSLSEAGPLRNILNRIHDRRESRRAPPPSCAPGPEISSPPSTHCPTCPLPCSPSPESMMEPIVAVPQPWPLGGTTPTSLQPDTALEPRPGTGSTSKPGTPTPKTPDGLLVPSKVSIDLGQHLPTQQQLLSAAGKLDSLLQLVYAFLIVSGTATVLPWVAPVVSGLHSALGVVLSKSNAASTGQPTQSPGVSPAAPSSMNPPAS